MNAPPFLGSLTKTWLHAPCPLSSSFTRSRQRCPLVEETLPNKKTPLYLNAYYRYRFKLDAPCPLGSINRCPEGSPLVEKTLPND